MLLLRYLLRSSIPVTSRNVQIKFYEILNYLESTRGLTQSYTFTAIHCVGAYGPTKAECLAEYGENLADETSFDMVTQGIQILMISKTGTYEICARGAGSLNNMAAG